MKRAKIRKGKQSAFFVIPFVPYDRYSGNYLNAKTFCRRYCNKSEGHDKMLCLNQYDEQGDKGEYSWRYSLNGMLRRCLRDSFESQMAQLLNKAKENVTKDVVFCLRRRCKKNDNHLLTE